MLINQCTPKISHVYEPPKKTLRFNNKIEKGIININQSEKMPQINRKNAYFPSNNFKPVLNAISESSEEKNFDEFKTKIKNYLDNTVITMDYIKRDFSGIIEKRVVNLPFKKIAEGKYDLSQNCANASIAIVKCLTEHFGHHPDGYNMGIAVVPYKTQMILLYKSEKIDDIDGLFNHVYIYFEHKDINESLIMDATTSNFLRKGPLFFGTHKELKDMFIDTLNKSYNYELSNTIFNSSNHSHNCSIARQIVRYIFDKEGDVDYLSSELINAWYGKHTLTM